MKKISIIGAGNVGTSAALYIAEKRLGHITLVDIREGLARGKAMDLMQAAPLREYDIEIRGSSDFMDLMYSDVVVVTAGRVRSPGMKREDLLMDNAELVAPLADVIRRAAPEAVVIVVTEPVDAMTYLLLRKSGFPPARVLGLTGVLDATRFRYFIAEELGISAQDVTAMVIGGHHEHMVPLAGYSRAGGVPITELLPAEKIAAIVDKVREAGRRIVEELRQGSSFYTPGACISEMVEAIVRDSKRILPVATLLQGEYGLNDVCVGVPALIGKGGVEKIYQLKLDETDLKLFRHSAEVVMDSQKAVLRVEDMTRALDLL
jgi:malate dehydrogenase